MRKEGLRSKTKRRFKVTTVSNHGYSISENHLSKNFKPNTLKETWYNTKRLHSSLEYKTPKEVELEFMNIKNAA